KAKGTTYVSTLAVYEPRGRVEPTPLLDAVLSTDAKEALQSAQANPPAPPSIGNRNTGATPAEWRWKNLLHNIAAFRASGLRLATGTDVGIVGTHHGWATLREIELLVQGGLTPLEAITAATGNSAKALHVDNERGFIKEGMLADLVLIEGAPYKTIGDIERISRVFLGGRELDRKKMASDIAQPGITPLVANKAPEELDDFERTDNRSLIDTLWVNAYDAGHDHTKMVWGRTLRSGANHALSVMSQMSEVERPFARVSLPLSRGAVVPIDASSFRGIQF